MFRARVMCQQHDCASIRSAEVYADMSRPNVKLTLSMSIRLSYRYRFTHLFGGFVGTIYYKDPCLRSLLFRGKDNSIFPEHSPNVFHC